MATSANVCHVLGIAFFMAALMVLCLHVFTNRDYSEYEKVDLIKIDAEMRELQGIMCRDIVKVQKWTLDRMCELSANVYGLCWRPVLGPGNIVVENNLPKGVNFMSFAADAEYTTNYKHLKAKPNIVLFIADDMGYSDIASYGHPQRKKNYIDTFAESGIRFQSVYAAESLCTPSRAGLLTGRLPVRVGMISHEGGFRVAQPTDKGGLQPEEITIPEVLKAAGYRTGINGYNSTDGKYLPSRQGFDFVGINIPLSNNRACDQTEVSILPSGLMFQFYQKDGPSQEHCFVYNDTEIVQQPINFTTLTQSMLGDFERFFDSQPKDQPFFFYFSFAQVHEMMFSLMTGFAEKSESGIYGGDILEMADAIKTVMESLRRRRMEKDTMTLFMSDHGPHIALCKLGGSTPFRGGKATSFEGGYRIPFFLSWPSVVPPNGVSQSVLSTLDLLPTFAALTGAELPNTKLDGTDQREYFFNSQKTTGQREIWYYCNDILMAMRLGPYKLHFRTIPYPEPHSIAFTLGCPNGMPLSSFYATDVAVCSLNVTIPHDPPLVYNILRDPGEKWPLQYDQLSIALRSKIDGMVTEHKASLLDRRRPQLGTMRDPKVQPCCDPPKCKCNYSGKSVLSTNKFRKSKIKAMYEDEPFVF